MSKKVIAIIDSSDNKDFTLDTFETAYDEALSIIAEYKGQEITLTSGGSSWMDHVAVKLYLNNKEKFKLRLRLPCSFDVKSSQYDNKTPEGKKLNQLHREFSKVCDFDSLEEISRCIENKDVTFGEYDGFLKRNDIVAKECDLCIAFTGESLEKFKKKRGGTLYTWNRVKSKKIHVDLSL